MRRAATIAFLSIAIAYYYLASETCEGTYCMTSSVPKLCYLKSSEFQTKAFDPRESFSFYANFSSFELIDVHTNRVLGRASIRGPDSKEITYQYTESPLLCIPPKSLLVVTFGRLSLFEKNIYISTHERRDTALTGIFMRPSIFNTITRCLLLSLLFVPRNDYETKTVSKTVFRSKAMLHYVVDEQKYDTLPMLYARVDENFRSRAVKYRSRGYTYFPPLEFEERPGMTSYVVCVLSLSKEIYPSTVLPTIQV